MRLALKMHESVSQCVARVPSVRVAATVAGLLLVLLAAGLIVRDAVSADLPRAPEAASARQCGPTARVVLEPGLLRRTFQAVNEDRGCWTDAICSAVAGFTQAEYDRFVKLVRQESLALTSEERAMRPREARPFHTYTHANNPERAFQCLEQRGDGSRADVQLDIYWLFKDSPIPAGAYKWLKKAIEGGSASAQYVMSEETLSFGPGDPKAPREVAEHANAASYHDLLKKAADGELAVAQVTLARYYLGDARYSWNEGRVIWEKKPIDAKSAIGLYRKAAAQTSDRDSRDNAMAELGHLYFRGTHVPQDYAEAYRWYVKLEPARLAGCGQLSIVLFNLKRMYREALGVPRDAEKADQLEKYDKACVGSKR